MYYTKSTHPGSIIRAGMDGSNPVTVITGLGNPHGIKIDLTTSKLFWTDYKTGRIESSNFQGGDRRTVVQLSSERTRGIAIADGRIYWGGERSYKLESSTMTGEDIVTLHTETESINQLAVVPDSSLLQNRTNDCEARRCEKVCVLTAASFRCLD